MGSTSMMDRRSFCAAPIGAVTISLVSGKAMAQGAMLRQPVASSTIRRHLAADIANFHTCDTEVLKYVQCKPI
jgi:hypothetical protein